jgi:Zn-dependent peptidase ImmA (M78 family)
LTDRSTGERNPRVRAFLNRYSGKESGSIELAARRAASNLVKKAGLHPRRTPYPFDALAKAAGVARVEERQNLPAPAMLLRDGSESVIAVRPSLPSSRRSFALLHELGHTLVNAASHDLGLLSRADAQRVREYYSDEERVCDAIAVELLLPLAPFKAAVLNVPTPPNWAAIIRLAKHFGASLEATTIRYQEFSDGPLLLQTWSVGERGELALSRSWGRGMLRAFSERRSSAPTFLRRFVRGHHARAMESLVVPVGGKRRTVSVDLLRRRTTKRNEVLLLGVPGPLSD